MEKNSKHHGIKRWDVLVKLLPSDRPIKFFEVGVWKGILMEKILGLMPNLEWFGVDNWRAPVRGSGNALTSKDLSLKSQKEFNAAYNKTVSIEHKYKNRTHIIMSDSAEIAANFEDGEFDCVFIDADHSYNGCKRDIIAWAKKVKAGGMLAGHDYANNEGEVKRAVDELLGEVELYDDHVWVKRM